MFIIDILPNNYNLTYLTFFIELASKYYRILLVLIAMRYVFRVQMSNYNCINVEPYRFYYLPVSIKHN